jgi:hypothetical protein
MSALAEPAPVAVARLGVGTSLRRAARGWYEHSLRLLTLNTLFSGIALTLLVAAFAQPAAVVLLVLLGPLGAALMHCAVKVVEQDELRLADGLLGLRLHWRRGLALGALGVVAVLLTVVAIAFYTGQGATTWPLAVLTLYVSGLLALYQLAVWPLAVVERDRPFRDVVRDAAYALVRRPRAFTGLGLALLAVNLIGLAAGVLPFLTMTISYSLLAVAYFALPQKVEEG